MELQAIKQRFGIIGNSRGLNNALKIAERVAPTNLSVLITGESGVGKEVFSHIMHALSPRKHEGFIAVNCGAIPEGTIDSELFGHEKGAFTGAQDKRKGYFETVNKGTIFLDEIGEMPIGTQARLLRVLETGEFIKVGSSNVLKTDVRVIAATNVNLVELVAQGKFREDLYYRLNTVPIHVPPLRERKEDIYLLFRKFSVDFAEKYRAANIALDDDAIKLLENYSWPGNIRELKNIAEQISVLAKSKIITKEELMSYLPDAHESNRLPMLKRNGQDNIMSERELLYKMLFDMKSDLNELKKFVLNMAKGESINLPDGELPDVFKETTLPVAAESTALHHYNEGIKIESKTEHAESTPIVIESDDHYEEESIEESLSIADMEKELIKRALIKHNGKRKDAALDLEISERTLYRKIKEYDIHA
ncbi:MAG: sigma-54-dependent Fis family transcriptional regulator [Bacteroidetes bacterium]|nr:sigma-54-dependent Fis family transcriptional regulator [Bacteroidota bacterium]